MALALTVLVGVASASASGFVAEEYPAEIEGKTFGGTSILSFGPRYAECTGLNFAGGLSESGPTLTPSIMEDASCEYEGEKLTLAMNGCKFIFHPDTEIENGSSFAGSFEIGPAGCGPVKMVRSACTLVFSPQTGIGLVDYKNVGTGKNATVAIEAEGSNIAYTVEGSHNACGNGGVAPLYARWEVKARNKVEEYEGLHVDADATGTYMGSKGFEAEEYPVTLFGDQDPANKHLLTMGLRTIECGNVHFGSALSAASTELAVTAWYEGCSTVPVLGTTFLVTVKMNSCHYVFHVLGGGPPYAGTTDVACSTGGDAIEANLFASAQEQKEGKSVCGYRIAPQSGLEGVGYSTVGEASGRGAKANLELKGITFGVVGNQMGCGKPKSNGTYTGATTLYGLYGLH
jgi:hypothetical protein